jgi:hypothetical protein
MAMTSPTSTRRTNGGPLRVVLSVLLTANALMQLAGGIMMLARPEKIARDTFGIHITGDAAPLMAVIGGATLGYALLSATAAVGVLQRLAWARLSVVLASGMLITVGAVMLGSGLRIGTLDLAKGFILMVVGGLAHREAGRAPMRGRTHGLQTLREKS